MFELRIVAVSTSEIIAGLVVDTGEIEVKENTWQQFTRFRIGLIFLTIDLTWLRK
jgi:hypothetical protein